jgi:mRNA interferase HigB
VFNIIHQKALLKYAYRHPDAKNSLFEWYHTFQEQSFSTFNELKSSYGSASIIGDNRVIFNILGNKYRLIVRISFMYKTAQIKWFGTHAEYDKLDATTVQPKP